MKSFEELSQGDFPTFVVGTPRRAGDRSAAPSRQPLCLVLLFGLFLSHAGIVNAAFDFIVVPIKDPSVGIPFTTPDAALGAPWASYQLSVQSTAGEIIQAVQLNITGQFHQRWVDFDADGTPDNPTASGPSMSNGDTHVTTATGAVFGSGPIENNSGNGSPLSDTAASDYGTGTFLQAAWANPVASTNVAIAYLVAPKSSFPFQSVDIRLANPTGSIIGNAGFCFLEGCSSGLITSGNGLKIWDSDATPSLLDNTDFGAVTQGSLQQRTYSIFNDTANTQTLASPSFSGPFSLVGGFPSSVAPHGSVSFTLGLNTSAIGSYSGSISFGTSVIGLDPYNFSLAAKVVPEPASAVLVALVLVGFGAIRQRRNSRCPQLVICVTL